MHLIETIMLSIVATFLDYSISENIDKISKVKAIDSTIRGSTNSRHLRKL